MINLPGGGGVQYNTWVSLTWAYHIMYVPHVTHIMCWAVNKCETN